MDKELAYQLFFSTPEGQEIFRDLESFCGVNGVSYCLGGNTYDMVFLEGRKAVFYYIKHMMEVNNVDTVSE